jgi:hypothetical protein
LFGFVFLKEGDDVSVALFNNWRCVRGCVLNLHPPRVENAEQHVCEVRAYHLVVAPETAYYDYCIGCELCADSDSLFSQPFDRRFLLNARPRTINT